MSQTIRVKHDGLQTLIHDLGVELFDKSRTQKKVRFVVRNLGKQTAIRLVTPDVYVDGWEWMIDGEIPGPYATVEAASNDVSGMLREWQLWQQGKPHQGIAKSEIDEMWKQTKDEMMQQIRDEHAL